MKFDYRSDGWVEPSDNALDQLRHLYRIIQDREYQMRLCAHSPGLQPAIDKLIGYVTGRNDDSDPFTETLGADRFLPSSGETNPGRIAREHPHLLHAILTAAHAVAFELEARLLLDISLAERAILASLNTPDATPTAPAHRPSR